MNTPAFTPWLRPRYVILLGLLLAAGFCVIGVTGFFRLSSETATMRRSLMDAAGGAWDKKLALRVGGFTTCLVRAGSRFFPMDTEPRAAIEAVRGAEVGIYQLQSGPVCFDHATVFAAVDKAMAKRGWQRVVGVSKAQELVGVYVPERAMSTRRMRACVMVLHDTELVVAAGCGNLEPLLQLAEKKVDWAGLRIR